MFFFGIVNKDTWAPCWKEAIWEGLGDGVPSQGRDCGQESPVTTGSENQGHMCVWGLLGDPLAQPSINWLPPPEGFLWVAWEAGLSRSAPEAWEIGSHSGFMPLTSEVVCYRATASWTTCHLPDSRKSWCNSSGPPGHQHFDQRSFVLGVQKFFVMFFLRNIGLGIINLNTQEHILPTTSCSSTTNNNNKSSTLWLVCMSSWRVRAGDYVIESGMTQLRDRNLGLNSGLLYLTWKFTGSMAWPLKNGSSTQINIYSLGIFFLLSCINIYLSVYQSEKCWVLLITLQTLEKTGLKRRKGGSHFITQKRCHIIQSWKRANLFWAP